MNFEESSKMDTMGDKLKVLDEVNESIKFIEGLERKRMKFKNHIIESRIQYKTE